ncbi:hypothetical protein AALP_AA1G299600 [Arabis alpina]|uniref:Pentacotripeptide-repeat region of PRORP domain-containing protein n=1 Tax=Arabis alpina TaxID=50452 RepID=A0A087HRK9_ARAAL|nr:hypothetical protein AALP_AA1G299600 [Arabis alpina]
MRFRPILVSSGYHLWKRACTTFTVPASEISHLWKRACSTTVAAPIAKADDVASQKAKVANMKRKMFKKLKSLRETGGDVSITLNEIMLEAEITQTDLIRWAKLLDKKHSEHQHAYEVFEWMSRNKMKFSPYEHAVYLDLIANTKGVKAAKAYFNYIDPNFNKMDTREKNWPAFQKLWDWHLKDYPVMGLVTCT